MAQGELVGSDLAIGGTTSVERLITDSVFALMADTPIPSIRVHDVIRRAGVSRSTFYRRFRSVDDVVKSFEDALLENMRSINTVALQVRFSDAEIDPTPTMISRMEVLRANREKIIVLNGPNGDPAFMHKATVFMHDHFRARLRDLPGDELLRDLYLSFALAGHNNLIQYWLEERPEISPRKVAAILNRLFYAPFFLDAETARITPHSPSFE